MGKKRNNPNKERVRGKKEAKELLAITRPATINLHRRLHACQFKKRAHTAIKEIKEYARRTMFTKDVRVDPTLNQEVWRNGVRNVDNRIDVLLERKKNEDEEAKDKLYTLVKLAN